MRSMLFDKRVISKIAIKLEKKKTELGSDVDERDFIHTRRCTLSKHRKALYGNASI